MIATENVILLFDRSMDFNAEIIKNELDLAQKTWEQREDKDLLNWVKELSPAQRKEVMKMREKIDEIKKDLVEDESELQ